MNGHSGESEENKGSPSKVLRCPTEFEDSPIFVTAEGLEECGLISKIQNHSGREHIVILLMHLLVALGLAAQEACLQTCCCHTAVLKALLPYHSLLCQDIT